MAYVAHMSHDGASAHLLTTSQVAARLGIHRGTVLQRVTYGHLTPTTQLPGRTGAYLFDAEQVEALAAERETEATR